MYKGADLMAWAEKRANRWRAFPPAGGQPLAVVIAEAYLRGAIDALADETDVKRLDRSVADSALPQPGRIPGI